jgi:hypothetical protein
MPAELDVEELVSRSVAIVVCYYHFARAWPDWVAVVATIQAISEDAEALGVSFDAIGPLLQVELSDRFDRETADRLSLEFSDLFIFISASSPVIVAHH